MRRLSLALALGALAAAGAGCGEGDTTIISTTSSSTQTTPATSTTEPAEGTTTTTTTTTTSASGGGGGGGGGDEVLPGIPGDAESCGSGVFAAAGTTSCPFALNVAEDYFANPGGSFESFSPTTGESYEMSCTGSPAVTCTGGNNATVYIAPSGE